MCLKNFDVAICNQGSHEVYRKPFMTIPVKESMIRLLENAKLLEQRNDVRSLKLK